MNAVVVYDSKYGNTERIAQVIGEALGEDAKVIRADSPGVQIADADLVIVGCPTNGGRPTPAVVAFLDAIPDGALKNAKTAGFDTRLTSRFAKIFGYAAPKIAERLVAKGGVEIATPEGFLVQGTKGPIAPGELERAKAWGLSLKERIGKC